MCFRMTPDVVYALGGDVQIAEMVAAGAVVFTEAGYVCSARIVFFGSFFRWGVLS